MKLNLQKPLVIFDLETTGLDLVKDRVIQISYIKVFPDGKEVRGDELVNPEKTIPEVVIQLTGITNEDVKDKPTFKQLASKLNDVFTGSDIAGFNSNNFDVPLLAEEFLRAGIDFDFSKCRLIDACTIFRRMERRNLAAAYKFYCGRKMEEDFEAHRADQDTEATYRVLWDNWTNMPLVPTKTQRKCWRTIWTVWLNSPRQAIMLTLQVASYGQMSKGNAPKCSTLENTRDYPLPKYCASIQVITVGYWLATLPIIPSKC